jgi:hypothetical protein
MNSRRPDEVVAAARFLASEDSSFTKADVLLGPHVVPGVVPVLEQVVLSEFMA